MAKNYYSSVDQAPMGKETTKKKKSKKKIHSGSINQTMSPKSNKSEKKPKKKLTFTDQTKKNVPGTPIVPRGAGKPAHLGDKGFKLKFGDAFRTAKKSGKKVFTWKGNKYTTQTKSELESGKSEAAKFAAKGKSNKMSSADKGDRFSRAKTKWGQSKTLAEFFGKLKKKK